MGSPTTTSVADTGLSAATTYYYVIEAKAGAVTSPQSSQVSGLTMPNAPTGVVADAVSQSEIDLTWTAVPGATGYVVERAATSGGPYSIVGRPTAASFASTALSSITTYYYIVLAADASGSSASSSVASATTSLGAPTGVVVTVVSPAEIDLAWTPVSGATAYVVLRGTASGGPYTSVGTPTSASFANMGLSPATLYFYVVEATAGSFTSVNSSQVSATTLLGVPSGVTATAASPTEIDLSWSAVNGATGYVVERSSVSGGPYTTVGSPTSTSFANPGLSPATTYYYVVKATAGSVSSGPSVEVPVTTLLGAPTGAVATAVSTSEIDLSWSAVTGATGYVVLRSTTLGGPYSAVGSPTTTTFAGTGLSAGTTYYFVLEATAGAVISAFSTEVSTATLPMAPTGLTASAASPSEIDLSWTAVPGATGYVILRATSAGGPFSSIGTSVTPSFANTALSANTTYYYEVEATDAAGHSANSAVVSATTKLAVPIGLTATGHEENTISLSWAAVSGATSYIVLKSSTSGGPFSTLATTTTNSYADTPTTEDVNWYYIVEAVNAASTSPPSAQAIGIIP
jgi:fibronectin type 3 domain-containing protein